MHDDLFVLRTSSSSEGFLRRRAVLEAKYFSPFGLGLPKWYTTLYRTYAKKMIDCYNKAAADPGSFFKAVVTQNRVTLHTVDLL